MKKLLIFSLFICIVAQLEAQNTTSITGKVLDEATKEGVELAGIRLLNAKDSTYVSGTATDKTGKFSLSVRPAKYILQVSFIGYATLNIDVNAQRNVALGDILMKEDGILLGEAVITGQTPEIVIKGDTVEYNADSYKVQEGAVLEELIKKIPGAEIDSEGKITVNGKDISKILVDGKEFFSDDPKTATQNLPAKMVEKLQVLDKKSDLAQLTGFDDGEEETVINLVVKPEMKEGLMSNILVGVGNKDRYEGNGFVNYAKNDTRITVLGNVNNTNNENANVRGGSSRGGELTSKEVGLNIASEPSTKFKYDADVYYSRTDHDLISDSYTEYASGNNRTSTRNSNSTTKNDNLRSRIRMEWSPDSLTKIIFRPNLSYSKNNSFSLGTSSRTNADKPQDDIFTSDNSSSKRNTFNINGSLLINRKLNENGRSITLEVSGGNSNGNTDGDTYSLTDYVNIADSVLLQDQIYHQDNNSYNWRARVSYLEPIWRNSDNTKLNLLEIAYNIRSSHSETDKITYDYDDATKGYTSIADDYTRNTVNDFINQNITLSFQARRKKYNYTIGADFQPSSTKTKVIQPNRPDRDNPRRNYLNFAPRLEFNYLWDRRHNLRLRYEGRTNQASTDQLFDGIISQTALDTLRGNPSLRPSFTHNLDIRYQKYMPENASSLMFFGRFSYTDNDIVTISEWGPGNSKNTTYTNVNGNMNGNFRLMYNTPLRNKKFSINTSTFGNYRKDNTYITNEGESPQKNVADVFRIGERLRLRYSTDGIKLRLGDSELDLGSFLFNVGVNFSYENTAYTVSKNRNASIYDYGGSADFSWILPNGLAFESDANYSTNSGYDNNFKQNMWLWNAAISKAGIFKLKNATIRIKVYDILKERTNISRSSGNDGVTYTTTNTIGSYFMVNFIYRFSSFKGGLKSSDMEPQRGPGGPGRGGRPPMRM
jgi:hypothetical protein